MASFLEIVAERLGAEHRLEAAERHEEPLPPTLEAFHVGHTNSLSLDWVGRGEGNIILGPGVYFTTNLGFALEYQKYNRKTAYLTTATIATEGLYDPTWGIPTELAEKVIELSRSCGIRHADSFRYGSGSIGIIMKKHGFDKGRKLLAEIGIKGAYEVLPSGAIEIAVFDLSILSNVKHEELAPKKEVASLVKAEDTPPKPGPVSGAPKQAMWPHLLAGDGAAWERILAKLGVPPGAEATFLGGGAHGAAFRIGDRVLKLTDDRIEALSALTLKKKPMTEAYKVFEVYRFKDHQKVYALWLEALDPADDLYREVADKWQYMGNTPLTPDSVKEFTAIYRDVFDPEALAWLARCAQGLVDRGIHNSDFHRGNLLKRPGTGEHVIIDIGHGSQAPRSRISKAQTDDMRPEYDFTLSKGVRGKHFEDFRRGVAITLLAEHKRLKYNDLTTQQKEFFKLLLMKNGNEHFYAPLFDEKLKTTTSKDVIEQTKELYDIHIDAVVDFLIDLAKMKYDKVDALPNTTDGRREKRRAANDIMAVNTALDSVTGPLGAHSPILRIIADANRLPGGFNHYAEFVIDTISAGLRVRVGRIDERNPEDVMFWNPSLTIPDLEPFSDFCQLTNTAFDNYIVRITSGLLIPGQSTHDVADRLRERKADWPEHVDNIKIYGGSTSSARYWKMDIKTDMGIWWYIGPTMVSRLNLIAEEIHDEVEAKLKKIELENSEMKKFTDEPTVDIPKNASADQLALLRMFELQGVDQIPATELRKSPLYKFPYVKDLVDRNKIITPDLVKKTPPPAPPTDVLKWLRENAVTAVKPFTMNVQRIWDKPNYAWIMGINANTTPVLDNEGNYVENNPVSSLFGPEGTKQLYRYAQGTNHPSIDRDTASIGWVRFTILDRDIFIDEVQTDLFKSHEDTHVLEPQFQKLLGSMPAVLKMLAESFITDMRGRGYQRFFWPGIQMKRDMYSADPPESVYEDLPGKLRFQRSTLYGLDELAPLRDSWNKRYGDKPPDMPVWVLASRADILDVLAGRIFSEEEFS